MTFDPGTITIIRRLALFFAVGALLLSVVGRRLELLQFKPGGSSFGTLIRPIFLGILIVALLIALRWEIVGGLIAAFATGGLVAFTTNQLINSHAYVVIAAFAIPAILWVLIDAHALPALQAAGVVAAAGLVAVGGFLAGTYFYNQTWGPTHPESLAEVLPDSPIEWAWSGGVSASAASVRAKAESDFTTARLAVSTSPEFGDPKWFDEIERVDRVVTFRPAGLDAATRHYYAVEVDGELDLIRSGQFRTFPEGPSSFTVAFGACARVGSNGRVFDAIADIDPLLYLILGDFHYGDNDLDSIDEYRKVLDLTLGQPGQAALYRSTPVAYVWDDHDYGANDSNRSSRARGAAMASYREYVPSYELAGPVSALYQSFVIGRVRFVMTDARSERDDQSKFDDESKTMLGLAQKEWLLDQLVAGSNGQELVVWINPVPWVAATKTGADNWAGYNTERTEIANFIADNDIDNLVMISADAHMVAIDDGTNTNFSDTPGPGFPLLHAAALDRPGSAKGGPYSEGVIAGSGQFGTIDIVDEGGDIEVTLSALNWEGTTLLDYRFVVPTS